MIYIRIFWTIIKSNWGSGPIIYPTLIFKTRKNLTGSYKKKYKKPFCLVIINVRIHSTWEVLDYHLAIGGFFLQFIRGSITRMTRVPQQLITFLIYMMIINKVDGIVWVQTVLKSLINRKVFKIDFNLIKWQVIFIYLYFKYNLYLTMSQSVKN